MYIDPKYLSQLLVIIEAGSFAEGAVRLGLTQPALSRNIRILEEAVGARLLQRSRSGTKPTELGLRFANCGRSIRSAIETAAAMANGVISGSAGELRIGCQHFLANSMLADPLNRFLAEHEGVIAKVEMTSPPAIDLLLASHHIDIALSRLSLVEVSSDIRVERIMNDEMLILCRSEHPLRRLRRVDSENLINMRWISYPNSGQLGFRRDFERTLSILGLTTRHIALETDSPEFIFDVLENSDFLTMLPRSSLIRRQREKKIAVLEVGKPMMLRPIGLAYRRAPDHPTLVKAFISHFKSTFEAQLS